MKVLLVTNMYPQESTPYYGIFVKEQEIAIKNKYCDVNYTIFYIDGKKNILNYIKSIYQINSLLKKEHFDLIHIHYGFSGIFLLKKLPISIPICITLHGGDIQIEQKKYIQVFLTKKILQKTNFAITLNERMNSIAKRYLKQTQIIPCSVNTAFFIPAYHQKKDDKKIIIFPSNKMRFEKNYPLFEKVIDILQNNYNIDCETYNIDKMSRIEVLKLYQKADLMLMTSISEGSPQVVKEAMSCNLPVISTNVGDVATLLNGVKNSAVSLDFNEYRLAELCYKSLNDQISGINGRNKIFQLELDDEQTATKIYNVYKHLINNHK